MRKVISTKLINDSNENATRIMSTRHISDFKAKYREKGILTAGNKGYISCHIKVFYQEKNGKREMVAK